MHKNIIGNFFFHLVTFSAGALLASTLLKNSYVDETFFSFKFIELVRLIIMLFLGYYVAYWVSIKSNSLQKRKDLCLILINEANSILTEQKNLTISFAEKKCDCNKDNGKLVLSGFRRLNNKIDSIIKLTQQIDNNLKTSNIESEFQLLKEQFGENFMTGFDDNQSKALRKDFDKFEKSFDDLRIELLL